VSGAVPILMYHQISPRPHPAFRKYTVMPGAFARQMAWLARTGHVAISLDLLAGSRAGRAALPSRPVVITFDDGFRESVEHATPVLAKHGFTATYFVVAGLVGIESAWLEAERGVAFPLASWPELRAVVDAGMHIGSHSLSHPRLTALARAACRRELVGSRAVLEDRLGIEVHHLAYPFGSYDAGVQDAAADAGYQMACSVRAGRSTPSDDLLALHRVPVIGEEGMLDFIARLYTARPVGALLRETTQHAWRSVRRSAGT
jgi:peptidoglycan/xylan/chitin deacetylase (PgdA/CDA1 family)